MALQSIDRNANHQPASSGDLSTDAIVRKPVVVAMPDGSESIAIHPMGHLSMSWDHRAFDGAYAGRFLSRVKQILETQDWSAEL